MNYRNLIFILIAVMLAGCEEEPPTASFTHSPLNPEVGETVIFTNASTKATSYTWDFGDGTTSTSDNPTHSYNNEGIYTVELKATNEDGSDTYTASVPVSHPPPVAVFTANKTSAWVDETITFANQSEDAVSYSWTFGDGGTSTVMNPTHAYTDDGVYTVQLTATGMGGDTDAATTDIEIDWRPPVAAFTMDKTSPTQPNVVITFTNDSENAASYSWDFGDGSTSTATNPTHSYSAEGIYTIQLTATGFGGDTDVATTYMEIVWPPPVAAFTMDKSMVAPGETVTFTNASQFAVSYSWDFGDGSSSTATNPTHSYASMGTYTVTLTATGYNAGTDTYSSTVTVCHPPVASFTFSPPHPQIGEDVYFTNTSTGASSYLWNFGDGTAASTHEHPTHAYSSGGSYTVTLTATGDCGSDTYSDVVPLPQPPVPTNIFPGVGIMDMELEDTWGVISNQLGDWVYLGWGYLGNYILHLVESPSTDVLGFFLSVYTSTTMSSADVCIQLNAQENFVGETPEGIRVGNTLAEVEAAYGPPLVHDTERDYYRYNTLGLGFFYNPSTLEVEIIAIYPPYTKKSTNHIHQIIDTLPLRDLDFQQ